MAIKLIICIVIAGLAGFVGYQTAESAFAGEFTILYSLDKQENDQAIVGAINGAQKYAYFAIYEFTKTNIEEALIKAKQRGVDVEGIMDASQSDDGGPQAAIIKKLRAAGIPVETQKHPLGIMHIKMLVTDNAYALGSYNWTESATTENDEVLEVGTNDGLRKQYLRIIEEVLTANK